MARRARYWACSRPARTIGFDNAIDVFLGILRKDGRGGLGLTHQSFQVDDPFVRDSCSGCGRFARFAHTPILGDRFLGPGTSIPIAVRDT